jgi:hypothetical protein
VGVPVGACALAVAVGVWVPVGDGTIGCHQKRANASPVRS